MKNAIFFLLCFLFVLNLTGQEVEFYVSKAGNDINPGTKEEPVATVEVARDLIRKYKTVQDYPKNGFVVWVDEGEYYQNKLK